MAFQVDRRCHPSSAPRLHRRVAAFTLAETLVSLSVLALVSVVCGSVVTLATRAVTQGNEGAGASSVAARAAADWVNDDLKVATGFTEKTATAVTMVVPDRTGDNVAETIRYAWSGAAGSTIGAYAVPAYSLTRELNGAAPVTVASDVRTFALTFESADAGPQPAKESEEMLLGSHEVADGPSVLGFALTSASWPAQYFKPPLLHNAISWKITKVRLKLRRNGSATGTLTVQVRPTDASGTPNGAAVGSGSISIASLPSAAADWVTIPFATPADNLDPTKPYAVAVTTTAAGTPVYVSYDSAATDGNKKYSTTSNGGTAWTAAVSTSALQFGVYGTQKTQDP